MGKLALQFIQFLRHDYELFDNNLYQVNENSENFNYRKLLDDETYVEKTNSQAKKFYELYCNFMENKYY